jgi:type IV pilus assembly protein PilB
VCKFLLAPAKQLGDFVKRLGEILIEHGSITQQQLEEALAKQKKMQGRLLGEVLIELKYVSEEDIVVALATQFNVPYLPIGNFSLNEKADEFISKEIIQKYLCVPLDRVGSVMTVVMADPTNEKALQEIEAASKCKVQAFVGSVTEIKTAIREHFGIDISGPAKPGEQVSQVSFRSAVKKKDNNSD